MLWSIILISTHIFFNDSMKIEEVISDANLYEQNGVTFSTEKPCEEALIDLALSPQSDLKIQEPTIHRIEGVLYVDLKIVSGGSPPFEARESLRCLGISKN